MSGKYPRSSMQYKKHSLARDCNCDAEVKKLAKFDSMFGSNAENIKLPDYRR